MERERIEQETERRVEKNKRINKIKSRKEEKQRIETTDKNIFKFQNEEKQKKGGNVVLNTFHYFLCISVFML